MTVWQGTTARTAATGSNKQHLYKSVSDRCEYDRKDKCMQVASSGNLQAGTRQKTEQMDSREAVPERRALWQSRKTGKPVHGVVCAVRTMHSVARLCPLIQPLVKGIAVIT